MTVMRRPAAVVRAATSISASTATRSTDAPRADDSNPACTSVSHSAAAATYDAGLDRSPTTGSTPGRAGASGDVFEWRTSAVTRCPARTNASSTAEPT